MSKEMFWPSVSILARAEKRAVPEPGESSAATKRDKVHGYKLRDEWVCRNHRTLMTDDQVLECRRRYEFERGWAPARLAMTYGVSISYMRSLLSYTTRTKLFPKRPG